MGDNNINVFFVVILNAILFSISYFAACFLANEYVKYKYKEPTRIKTLLASKVLQTYKYKADQTIIQKYKYEKYNRNSILKQLIDDRYNVIYKMNYQENNGDRRARLYLLSKSLRERMFNIISIFVIDYYQRNGMELEFQEIGVLIDLSDHLVYYEETTAVITKSEILLDYMVYLHRLFTIIFKKELFRDKEMLCLRSFTDLNNRLKMTADSFQAVYLENHINEENKLAQKFFDFIEVFENIILLYFEMFDLNAI